MNKDNTYILNLPPFDAKILETNSGPVIFDRLRGKYVALTPEEWVRQHFVHYLTTQKGYPLSLMANEIAITLNSMTRRCDTVVYNNRLEPLMILEYKNPHITITQEIFDQIARYNSVLQVNYLTVSNGLTHYCGKIDYENQTFHYLQEIPDYRTLAQNRPFSSK